MSADKVKYRCSSEVHFFNIIDIYMNERQSHQIYSSGNEDLRHEPHVVPISQISKRARKGLQNNSTNQSWSPLNCLSYNTPTYSNAMVSEITPQDSKLVRKNQQVFSEQKSCSISKDNSS